jgi:hypothetical protein
MESKPPSDDVPFPAIPDKATPSVSSPSAHAPAPPTSEPADESPERKFFDFVSSRLDRGVAEEEIVEELMTQQGSPRNEAVKYVRSVSAYNLTENTSPTVLRRIAELQDEGKSPYMVVEALRDQNLTKQEGNRLLRDIEAMKADIEDDRTQIKTAAGTAIGAIVILGIGVFRSFVAAMFPDVRGGVFPWIIFSLIGVFWLVQSGMKHVRATQRIEKTEKIFRPPGPGTGPGA